MIALNHTSKRVTFSNWCWLKHSFCRVFQPRCILPKIVGENCSKFGFWVLFSSKEAMGRVMRSCIQSILKLVNTVIGMVGLAMIMYGVWLIRTWQREMGDLPFDDDSDHPAPWFIYTAVGLGVTFCVISCSGHVAAETANGCCLYLYMLFIFLLFILEAGVMADVFLNRDWEEDFPMDPTGSFDRFKGFIRSNFEICKWIGLTVVSVQGLCFLLSMVLKALGPHQYYDSDDDYVSERVPLLKNAVQPPHYVVGSPVAGSRNDAWSIRINEKTSR